jgi:hypothetical protein
MDYESQIAEVSRAYILNFPRMQTHYATRGRFENQKIRDNYRRHMMLFTDYWYNNKNAGVFFDAPFLEVYAEETQNPVAHKSTIPSVGELIAPNLYVYDPTNPNTPLVVEPHDNFEYSDDDLVEEY